MNYILFLLTIIPVVFGCGVTTHTLIAEKSFGFNKLDPLYQSIVSNNLDVLYAASMFPDWGYNCIIISDRLKNASETAHWLPFQIEAIKYLYATYQKPWNARAQQLITFIFGVMSHSVADIVWHNLKIVRNTGQGMIQAMANSDFNFNGADYDSDIHFIADAGGEFVTAIQYDLDYLGDFSIPYEDIIAIYQRMGISVSKFDLTVCMYALYGETEIIKRSPDDYAFDYLSSKSPFLVDFFEEWWIGGINSLSAWTTACWQNLTKMIDTNIVAPCHLYDGSLSISKPNYLASKLLNKIKNDTDSKIEYNKVEYNKINKVSDDCEVTKPRMVVRSVRQESKLGTAITVCDFNDDGKLEAIIGAPGLNQVGSIYVVPLTNEYDEIDLDEITMQQYNISTINGKQIGDRFGQALECLDVNLDGIDDLIIGVPGYKPNSNSNTFEFNRGQIQIYFGSKSGLGLIPNITITTTSSWDFGSKFRKENGVLFIEHYLVDKLITMKPSKTMVSGLSITCFDTRCTTNNFIFYQLAHDFWGWAGYQVRWWNNQLIVSEPLFNNTGRIYSYDPNNQQIGWQIIAHHNHSRLGLDFVINKNGTMVLSSPVSSLDKQYGAIYLINLNKLTNRIYSTNDFKNNVIVASDENTRFGWTLDLNDNLVPSRVYIGEPNYSTMQGAIKIVTLSTFPGIRCWTINSDDAYFGRTIKSTQSGLFVGAPYQSNRNNPDNVIEHAGAVYLYS